MKNFAAAWRQSCLFALPGLKKPEMATSTQLIGTKTVKNTNENGGETPHGIVFGQDDLCPGHRTPGTGDADPPFPPVEVSPRKKGGSQKDQHGNKTLFHGIRLL